MVLDLETMERFDPMMLQAAQQIAAQANGEDAINLMAGPSRMRRRWCRAAARIQQYYHYPRRRQARHRRHRRVDVRREGRDIRVAAVSRLTRASCASLVFVVPTISSVVAPCACNHWRPRWSPRHETAPWRVARNVNPQSELLVR